MDIEIHAFFIERPAVNTANEASIALVTLSLLVHVSQLWESIDNNTENNIQRYNIDQHPESQVENQPSPEVPIGSATDLHNLRDPSAEPDAQVQNI